MGSARYTDERIRLLCREYLVDFNQVRALMRAGFPEATANSNGWKIFQRPDVIMYLKELMDERNQKVQLTADLVLEELRRLAMSNIADYYKWSDKRGKYVLKPLSELTRAQTAAIAKYEPGEGYTLYSKDFSLDKLSKYFKLYSEMETVITNTVMMGEIKLNGVPLEFNIGKPAPKRGEQKKP